MGGHERLADEGAVLGVAVLDEGPLHGFFVRAAGAVDVFHRARVDARVVDAGGNRRGRGVEVGHLFGIETQVAAEFGQFHRFLHRRAGVGGHEVGQDVLLLADFLGVGVESAHELLVDGVARFAHHLEDRVGDVFGGQAQLAAHVVLHEFVEEGGVVVEQDVVEADAAADEDLLHARKGTQFAQELHVVLVGDGELVAGRRRQAAFGGAGPVLGLFGAGGDAEVGGGAAHVVEVALEVGLLRHETRFLHDALAAARLDDPALVEVERAEGAVAQAPAVAREAELHFGERRDAAGLVVIGMPGPGVGESVEGVEFGSGKGLAGRVLHHVDVVGVGLDERAGRKGVEVAILHAEAACVVELVRLQVVPAGQQDRTVAVVDRPAPVDGARNEGEVVHRKAGVERFGNRDQRFLAHSVADEVGPRIEQDRPLYLVRPVVVVGQAAQARLDAPQDDRYVFVGAADEVAVDDGGMVGPQAHLAAG